MSRISIAGGALSATLLALVAAAPARAAEAKDEQLTVQVTASGLVAGGCETCGAVTVTIAGADGSWRRRTLEAGRAGLVSLTDDGQPPADGEYTYEVRSAEHESSAGAVDRVTPLIRTGRLRVTGGVAASLDEPAVAHSDAPDAYVVADNLVVQGKTCMGTSCASDEPFGSEQLTLKGPQGSSPRLRLDVPNTTNDWYMSGSSGQLYFGDATKTVVTFSDGLPGSLYVDYNGQLGIGTTTPATTLHVYSFFTPALRLEQGSGSGVGAWDVSGGDTFSVNPVGNSGNRMLLRRDGSLAAGSLEAIGSTGVAQLRVTESSPTVAARRLLLLKNNGPGIFRFDNSASGQSWGFGSLGSGNFFVGSTPGQPLGFTLTPNGDLALTGTLTQGSDRNAKQAIEPVDAAALLERVARLPLSSWEYKGAAGVRHVGPMAQDFAAEFGLGADDTHLAPGDAAGVGLAAIQALKAENDHLNARLEALEAQLRALAAR